MQSFTYRHFLETPLLANQSGEVHPECTDRVGLSTTSSDLPTIHITVKNGQGLAPIFSANWAMRKFSVPAVYNKLCVFNRTNCFFRLVTCCSSLSSTIESRENDQIRVISANNQTRSAHKPLGLYLRIGNEV